MSLVVVRAETACSCALFRDKLLHVRLVQETTALHVREWLGLLYMFTCASGRDWMSGLHVRESGLHVRESAFVTCASGRFWASRARLTGLKRAIGRIGLIHAVLQLPSSLICALISQPWPVNMSPCLCHNTQCRSARCDPRPSSHAALQISDPLYLGIASTIYTLCELHRSTV